MSIVLFPYIDKQKVLARITYTRIWISALFTILLIVYSIAGLIVLVDGGELSTFGLAVYALVLFLVSAAFDGWLYFWTARMPRKKYGRGRISVLIPLAIAVYLALDIVAASLRGVVAIYFKGAVFVIALQALIWLLLLLYKYKSVLKEKK